MRNGLNTTFPIGYRMNSEEWVNYAKDYLAEHNLIANSRYVGINRMLKEEDIALLEKDKFVVSSRPRGVLSGFLVIVPNIGYAIYIPPFGAIQGPKRIRMRISRFVIENGAIFSCYCKKDTNIVIEDVLVWNNKNIWSSLSFLERWNTIFDSFFNKHYIADIQLQEVTIELRKYSSLQSIEEPNESNVIEFIPIAPKQKRLLWMKDKNNNTTNNVKDTKSFVFAKKELAAGPDVYSVWRSGERLGYGLVKTLAISKLLRNATSEQIPVTISWNTNFEKWEILSASTQ